MTNAATTRYIRADIADELRKSRDHHASTIFIQEARIASQAAEIERLREHNDMADARFKEMFNEYGEMGGRVASQKAEIDALKPLLREARCPQLLCDGGLVPVFANPRDDTFEIQNCKWCIERDLALNGDTP